MTGDVDTAAADALEVELVLNSAMVGSARGKAALARLLARLRDLEDKRGEAESGDDRDAVVSGAAPPPRLAVDGNGFCWRVYETHWSMCPVNPDNDPVPQPVTYYEPVSEHPAKRAYISGVIRELQKGEAIDALATLRHLVDAYEEGVEVSFSPKACWAALATLSRLAGSAESAGGTTTTGETEVGDDRRAVASGAGAREKPFDEWSRAEIEKVVTFYEDGIRMVLAEDWRAIGGRRAVRAIAPLIINPRPLSDRALEVLRERVGERLAVEMSRGTTTTGHPSSPGVAFMRGDGSFPPAPEPGGEVALLRARLHAAERELAVNVEWREGLQESELREHKKRVAAEARLVSTIAALSALVEFAPEHLGRALRGHTMDHERWHELLDDARIALLAARDRPAPPDDCGNVTR